MPPFATQLASCTSAFQRFVRHPLWAPLNQPAHWNRLAALLNPAWSFTESLARVTQVIDEAPGTRSLWLQPNARFGSFQPGQHVLLELDIDGARQARCFSLSHAPRADGLLRLTIKQKHDGRVSRAAHALAVGQVLRLSRAQGHFAPRNGADKLLLVCAGSGITPMMAHLHALAASDSARDVTLLYGCTSQAEVIFADELKQLAARWPRLRVRLHFSAAAGRLDRASFEALVPDWKEREALLCGPDGFMRAIAALYARAGCGQQLQSESFGRQAARIDAGAAEHLVVIADGGKGFAARAGQSLLEAAEAAGLQPRFGCRRGICRTCQCRKRSGTVSNLLTGQLSGSGDELIQLCISTPHSGLELAL